MIYLLFGIISGLLLLSIVAFKYDLNAPTFLLNAAFWCASFCACLYDKRWGFEYQLLVEVVTLALSGFFLGSLVIYIIDKRVGKPNVRNLVPIKITTVRYAAYLCFQVVLYFLTLIVLSRNAGGFSVIKLASIIGGYYELNKKGGTIYSSALVNIGQIVNFSGTYYIIYIMMNNINAKQKNHPLVYINFIIGAVGSLLMGTKAAFYMYIIGGFVIYIVLRQKKNGWKRNIDFKMVLRVILILCVLLFTFNIIDSWQGRTLTNVGPVDKLATYLGSPLKNLELFLIENNSSNNAIFGAQTFKSIYNDLYELTGNSDYSIINLYKYRWVNGSPLGNVYTMFMPLYSDFGSIGTFAIMIIIGMFTQRIYDMVKYDKHEYDVDYKVIFYGYLSFTIMFSFFSNKFFESIISKAGIYFIIGIFIFDMFFIGIRNGKISKRWKKRTRQKCSEMGNTSMVK